MSYNLSDFDFQLPERLIAQFPSHPRDHARLLVYDRASMNIRDDYFFNLNNYLPTGSSIVLNNSRVEKARLLSGNTEIFILRQVNPNTAEALVRPGKKFRMGKSTDFGDNITIKTLAVQQDGIRTLLVDPPFTDQVWDSYRKTPFPPYITQNESLAEEYQTVYARDEGSKAAPTAGLHFTESLLESLKGSGHPIIELTLHVGLGTFAPVKTENIEEHRMHSEWYSLSQHSAAKLTKAHHITAVGTTTARTLESIVAGGYLYKEADTTKERHFLSGSGTTDIFIRPGYRFLAVDSLITNFHLPKSTLLMMISALTGLEEMHRIYQHAIENEYRFYSFGDAMLIL